MKFEDSLTHLITTTFNITESGTQFPAVFNATLEYLCKRTNHSQYHRALIASGVEFTKPFSAKAFRLIMLESNHIHVDLKFYLLNLLTVTPKKVTSEFARSTYKSYNLSKCDAVHCWFYVRANRSHAIRNNKFLKKMLNIDVQPDAINQLHKNIAEFTPELLSFAKKKARYKLEFIWKHTNETSESMGMDLYIKSLRAYKEMAPTVLKCTDLHQLNKLRTAIKNETVNVIEKHTTKKNGHMINVGSDNKENAKFLLVVESESQMRELADGSFSKLEESIMSEDDQSRLIGEIDVSVSVLCDKHKGTRRGSLLNILFNRNVTKFFNFLRGNNHIAPKQKDVVDVIGRMGRPKFFKLVSKYLKVTEASVLKYVATLQNDLSIGEAIHA